jgi:hypothetical protein
MPSGILPPELKAVEELLSGDKIFTVPKYQRNFAHGSGHAMCEDV